MRTAFVYWTLCVERTRQYMQIQAKLHPSIDQRFRFARGFLLHYSDQCSHFIVNIYPVDISYILFLSQYCRIVPGTQNELWNVSRSHRGDCKPFAIPAFNIVECVLLLKLSDGFILFNLELFYRYQVVGMRAISLSLIHAFHQRTGQTLQSSCSEQLDKFSCSKIHTLCQ
ncbi:MAG: hypothetical protein EZS28_010114 [Streblomastix strix]|uniref:Uncharacterized protein n=1 Tax=Streblomastix strix TaxID=222440 RepID=A0A5J4WHB5_9EUKA|nr:MAG: hypothetical protein EZS28_010114 [Streblomastix strix]